MKTNSLPVGRTKNLVIQEVNEETLIYDLKTNKALCLNNTSAAVWKLCDGKKSLGQISYELSKQLKSSVSEDYVRFALEELKKADLILNLSENESYFNGLSRREVIRRIGLSSVIALPLISSLVAPSAANAASGQACTLDGNFNATSFGTSQSACAAALQACCQTVGRNAELSPLPPCLTGQPFCTCETKCV